VSQTPPQPSQVCAQCKSPMYPGQRFCPNCGAVTQAAFPSTVVASSFSNPSSGPAPYQQSATLASSPSNTGGQQPFSGYIQPNTGGQQSAPGYTQPNTGGRQPFSGYPQPNMGGQQPFPGYAQPSTNYPQMGFPPPPSYTPYSAPPPPADPYAPPPSIDPYALPSGNPYAQPLSNPYVPPSLPPAYPQPQMPQPQQPTGTYPQPPTKKGKRNWLVIGASLLVALVLVIGVMFALPRLRGGPSTTDGTQAISVQTIGSEVIGISDGKTIFDTKRDDGQLKQQAADKLKQGDTGSALSLFSQANATESNDGEALIYQEDLRIAASPHITFVVGAMPSGSDDIVGVSRDALQGAYLAQKEFNDGNKIPGLKVRLLIASSGGTAKNATLVAQQIVQLAKSDPTFVGVMGWPYSGLTFAAAQVLGQAQIPMVSSTASADSLNGISSYFFRVAPSNKAQGVAGTKYAEEQGAKNVAILADPANLYSQSLGNDFKQQFVADGGKVVVTNYTVGKTATIQPALTTALKQNPDLIYFSGYAADISTLLKDLTAAGAPNTLKVLGGDALYELSGYNGNTPAERSRLRFTTFSFPDEWDIAGMGGQKPAFYGEYASTFSGGKKGYGFDRSTNQATLSYDAMSALLKAAAATGKTTITSSDLQHALTTTAFQGASGYIKFGSDGNPVNKAFVVLKISPEGFTQMEKVIGNLTSAS